MIRTFFYLLDFYQQSFRNDLYNLMDPNLQQSKLPKYHPFAIPPHPDIYRKHRACSQFGLVSEQAFQQVCPCCNQLPRDPLPLNCSLKDVYQVSEPSGYFFTYIKLVIGVLGTIMIVNGIYTLVEIIDECVQKPTETGVCIYIYGIPFPRIHLFYKLTIIVLNIVVLVILYLFALFLIYRHTYLHMKNICQHQKPSDFSLMLSSFNHKQITIKDLCKFVEESNVVDIIYTHKIKKYLGWLSEKSILQAQHKNYINHNSPKADKIKKKIINLDNKLLYMKNKLLLGQDVEFRTDKVILTFQTPLDKEKFVQKYGLTLAKTIYYTFCGGSPLVINKCSIYLEPLGEPNQMIWENLQVSSKSRYLRVFVSNLVTFGMLFICFAVIAYLSKSEEDRNAVGDTFMSIFFAILVEVVNQVLSLQVDLFTGWEGRYTLTGQISMKLYKNCGAFFLNTTLLPFFLFILDWLHPEQDDIIRNILSLFFISNLISPYIGLILQPRHLVKLYWQRRIKKQGKQCMVTQIKANQKFQKTDFKLDQSYALISQLVMNCMFYGSIFPVGILLTFIGMIIIYWSSKWWILGYCSTPKFSFKLGTSINLILCWFPTVYAFGYAANLYMVKKNDDLDPIFSIYIALSTLPITLIFVFFAQRICTNIIKRRNVSLLACINKKKDPLTYKGLNPTTFIHQNLSVSASEQPKDIWNRLVNYAIAKQSGIVVNNDPEGQNIRSSYTSSLSSKRSATQAAVN